MQKVQKVKTLFLPCLTDQNERIFIPLRLVEITKYKALSWLYYKNGKPFQGDEIARVKKAKAQGKRIP
jgi:hypothetical protein